MRFGILSWAVLCSSRGRSPEYQGSYLGVLFVEGLTTVGQRRGMASSTALLRTQQFRAALSSRILLSRRAEDHGTQLILIALNSTLSSVFVVQVQGHSPPV